MERTQLEALIRKYNAGQCTQQEKEFLEQWYTSFEWGNTRFEDAVILEQLREDVWKEIMKEPLSQSAIVRRLSPASARIHWVKRIAAACVLLIAVYSTWFYFLKPVTPSIPSGTVTYDVAPGREGAILTLTDGKQIVLDSLNNGLIAQQNGAKVEFNDGQVTYNKDKITQAEVSFNTMSTPRGRKYQLALSDGTRVWLNAASSITFPTAFTGQERIVSITGEAYFEVAKNAKKPFRVKTNDMMVEVLGTHFHINNYDDEDIIKTTLLEGSVSVSKGSSHQLLIPGQQVQLSRDNNLKRVSNADIEQVIAWKNNQFYFKEADLKTVMRQLARWYDVEIVYAEGLPMNKHFGGEIPMDAMLSQILKGLEKNGFRFQLTGKQLTVLPSS